MPKLIVLEGADGVGKSTLADSLVSHYNAIKVRQPSSQNSVKFLRDVVKKDPDFLPFERQLLHSVTHVVDVYELLDKITNTNIVMDRCYLSGLVYGKIMSLTEKQLDLLKRIQRDVHAWIQTKFEVHVLLIHRDNRLDTPDQSLYEKALKWETIRDGYLEAFNSLHSTPGDYLISPSEKRTIVGLSKVDTPEASLQVALKAIEG